MRLEIVRVQGEAFGRATYEPGWKWSTHVGQKRGERWCRAEHLYYVMEGSAVAAYENGSQSVLQAGSLHYIPPGARQLGGRQRALRLAAPAGRRSVLEVSLGFYGSLAMMRVRHGPQCGSPRDSGPAG